MHVGDHLFILVYLPLTTEAGNNELMHAIETWNDDLNQAQEA